MGDGREGGYIKLWRRIESWPLFQAMTGNQRLVVFAILLGANWKPSVVWMGSQRVELARGEWLVSEDVLAKRAKVSRKVVRAAVAKLAAEGFLSTREVGQRVGNDWATSGQEKGPAMGPTQGPAARVLIVNKYEDYQGGDGEEGPAMGLSEGQPGASQGPKEGQPGARSKEGEEGEEGKNGARNSQAPLFKPKSDHREAPLESPKSEPAQGIGVIGTGEVESPTPPARVKTPTPATTRHASLTASLVAVFAEVRGGRYLHSGAKDAAAVKRLMAACPDDSEIARRWQCALNEAGFHRCDSLAQLATPERFNHFARAPAQVTKLRRLGAPDSANA